MKKIVIGTLGLLLGCSSAAMAEQVHFSADAVMKMPNAAPQKGFLSVGKAGTRFDYTEQGRKVSKIELPSAGIARILFPTQKTYLEFKMPVINKSSIGHDVQPCQASANLACQKVADEEFGGIKVERWTVMPKGAPKAITILWDKTRKMMISQVLPNGVKIINKLLGKEKYESLDVERWETAFTSPDGQTVKGTMVYAPKLEVAVVEQQPNGMVKELHNIKVSEPDEALFKVPAGYKKIAQPATTGSINK